jgi:putative transcriptional regulator
VPRIASGRFVLALVAIVLPASPFAAPSDPADTPAKPSLRGQLLIATPAMRDPRFEHAVILMVRHGQDGAMGIVINRPLGEQPLAALGAKDIAAAGNVRVVLGGPVQPEIGFVVHSSSCHRPGTIAVDGRIAATSSREILRDIADKAGPMKSLIAFGYAGWAPGQLEGELAHNVWYTAPADPGLVFDDDRDKVWEHATAHRTQDL